MKKLWLAILVLLLAIPALAVDQGFLMMMKPVVASCTTPAGDELSESFGEGSTACYSGATGNDATCSVTWTVVGDSVTFHHALQAGAPTGSCTYGLLSDTSNENLERIYHGLSSPIDASVQSWDLVFSFYINSVTIDVNQFIYIVGMDTDVTPGGSQIAMYIKNSAGTYKIGAYGGAGSTEVAVATGTWYVVKIHHDTTVGNAYFQVTGGGSTTCNIADTCRFVGGTAFDVQYLYIGSASGEGAGEAISFEIGYVTINTP